MAIQSALLSSANAQGRAIKLQNALTAACAGGLLAALAAWHSHTTPLRFLAGLLAGIVYANAFEYVLHRFILHAREGFLAVTHGVHHSTWRTAEEPLYVNFARSPWVVVLLFAGNALPVAALERGLHPGIASGMFVAFAAYFIVLEEIHWRTHVGTVPRWLDGCRRHHLRHHAGGSDAFNVFFPLCDWVFK